MKEKELYTIADIASILEVSAMTIERWYWWYNDNQYEKPEGLEILPQPIIVDNRKTRRWKKEDLPQLIKWKNALPKGQDGIMGKFNRRFEKKKKENV